MRLISWTLRSGSEQEQICFFAHGQYLTTKNFQPNHNNTNIDKILAELIIIETTDKRILSMIQYTTMATLTVIKLYKEFDDTWTKYQDKMYGPKTY
jgi:hypothetical protein